MRRALVFAWIATAMVFAGLIELGDTLVRAQSGIQSISVGSILACANQGVLSPVVGTGAAAAYYTCTIPAGMIRPGGGIEVVVKSKHTTGTASIGYTLSFGGTATAATSPTGAANQIESIHYFVMNAVGSQSSQVMTRESVDSNSGATALQVTDTAAVSTASPVIVKAQFNVANTDQITPEQFIVRLVQ